MKEHLSAILNSISRFSEEEINALSARFRMKSVEKNGFLLQAGDVSHEFYIVFTGCLRIYFIDRAGHEKTRYLMPAYHMGTALTSFISQQPSTEYVQALEETQVLAMNHEDFYQLVDSIQAWAVFYQKILEMAYSFQNRRIESLVTRSAEERFNDLMRQQPRLIQKVSNKVLASYLDMREETLSRLKSRQRDFDPDQ
jgi:CRP-like cAMP-binding protein